MRFRTREFVWIHRGQSIPIVLRHFWLTVHSERHHFLFSTGEHGDHKYLPFQYQESNHDAWLSLVQIRMPRQHNVQVKLEFALYYNLMILELIQFHHHEYGDFVL